MRAVAFLVVAFLLTLAAPASAQGQQHVAIEGYAYSAATLTVRVGDTVTWTNHDQAAHDVVTTSAPAAFRSPLLSTGQSWSQTFTVPGTYSYYCSVHPDMRAQVIVLPADTPEPAPPPHAPETPAPTENAPPAPAPMTTVATTTPVPTTTTPAPAPQTTQAAVTTTFDPMLAVAGLVAAVTIICLLLMGARPER